MKMRGASIIVAVVTIVSIFSLTVTILPESVRGATLFVGGVGPGNYTAIQDAIDASIAGDTIYVYNGTYFEHITIDKAITLVGENRNTTFIDGSNVGDVVRIVSSWVNISGFNIANGGDVGSPTWDSGLELWFADNCRIINNGFTQNDLFGVWSYESDNNVFIGNNASWNEWEAFYIEYSDNNLFHNNEIYNTTSIGAAGIYLDSSDNNIVTNNTITMRLNDLFVPVVGNVDLYESLNNTIEGNHLFTNTVGVNLLYSDYNTITNNTASYNVYGISVDEGSDFNTVTNNVVTKSEDYGLTLWSAHRNIVANNTVTNSEIFGIEVVVSENNTIVGNNISSSGWYGMEIDDSYNNVIIENTFLEGDYGIYADESGGNAIYHNNIMQNTHQAYDNTGDYQWDDGYPSGGNYWSDYTGVDEKSGPNQDQPGADGIGDTPYVIDVDSEDRYPLMYPFGIKQHRPPGMFQADLSGMDNENVTLKWALCEDVLELNPIVGYLIYRNTTFDSEGLGYGLIASLPNETSEFVDVSAGEGNPNNYFYKICAVDSDNTSICTSIQTSKFTQPLSMGLNLMSIPLIQSDNKIETVLQTLRFDNMWMYDSFEDEWSSFMKLKPYVVSVDSLNHTVGFWVCVSEDSNLTVAGVVPAVTEIHLRKGWNLVGFTSFQRTYTVGDLKADTSATRVEGLDQSNPPCFLKVLQDSDVLSAGHGYWVHVNTDTHWVLSNR